MLISPKLKFNAASILQQNIILSLNLIRLSASIILLYQQLKQNKNNLQTNAPYYRVSCELFNSTNINLFNRLLIIV